MDLKECTENWFHLVKVNLKLNTQYNLLISIVYLCVIPFVQGVSYLGNTEVAFCLENFVAVIGVILIVPIFAPEESSDIDEIIASKSANLFRPYIVRITLAIACVFILITIFCSVLKYNSCEFSLNLYIFGTFATALFLGAIGALASAISGNSIMGYAASIAYFIINMMTGSKFVGRFYIMSMKSNSFEEKYYIFIVSIILLIFSILIKVLKRRL